MNFRVIGGGKPSTTEHRQGELSPIERARCAVIDRVASAVWDADAGELQPWPKWADFVADAYSNADPAMLVQVSDTYRMARAAIGAMAPADEEVLLREIGVREPGVAAAIIEDWVKAVLG